MICKTERLAAHRAAQTGRRAKRRLSGGALLLAGSALLLAGCGSDASNRVGGATAGGVATGATIGLLGGPIGVIVGGAIGGGVAALTAQGTTAKQVDLGNPPWNRNAPDTGAAGPERAGTTAARGQASGGAGQASRRVAAASGVAAPSGGNAAGGNAAGGAPAGRPQDLLQAGGVGQGGSISEKKLPAP